MSRRIECVTVQERADWSVYDSVEIAFDRMRFGSPLDEVSADTDGLKFTSELFQQQVWLLGDTLGLGVDEVSTDLELLPASVDRDICRRTLRAGTVARPRWRWTGRRAAMAWSKSKPSGRSASRSRRTGRHRSTAGPSPSKAHPRCRRGRGRSRAFAATRRGEHVRSASVATAMQAVNAIPAVCEARPGFVTMAELPLRCSADVSLREPRAIDAAANCAHTVSYGEQRTVRVRPRGHRSCSS